MKIVILIGTGLLALVWTAFIALSAAVADWLASQGGQLPGGLYALGQWPMPPWVALWIDPALAETLRASVVWALDLAAALMPWILPLLAWVAPVLWVIWGLGLVALLVLAGLGVFLLGRLRRRSPRPRYG
ncbi:hypothetical protein [Rhodoferax aquaticus]|uniref:Uncharacterized protein n=1 Tax=Rhodoferax aquaticus TaxID=2527691 RepID=A0A515ENM6_9BURK|nr:hypothetical protein [Rhodoferax aquaticus]QDL54273.1 hypothetical protein EXZ61_08900 [Rhodoferax aquaticus]